MHTRMRCNVAALGWAALVALLGGCAGGGGEAPADRAITINGVFLGSQTQTRAVGDVGTVDLDIRRTNGSAALSGTGRLTLADTVFTGPITGTTSGNSAVIDVALAGYGTAEYNVMLNGAVLKGSFTHTAAGGVSEGGEVTLTGQLGANTTSLTGTSFGTSTDFGVPATQFTVRFVQTGDNVAVSGTYNGTPFTGPGVLIGSDLTFSFVQADGSTVNFTGVAAADAISGSYRIIGTDGTLVNHGIFVLDRPGVSPK